MKQYIKAKKNQAVNAHVRVLRYNDTLKWLLRFAFSQKIALKKFRAKSAARRGFLLETY